MPEEGEVVHGHHEGRPRPERRAERRAVEDVEPGGRAPEAVRVPERVPADAREATRAADGEGVELEPRAAGQLAEQAADVPCRARSGLRERRGVDPDPHAASACRTASRGSG